MVGSGLKEKYHDIVLLRAGCIKDCNEYWNKIERLISELHLRDNVIKKVGYIPDEEVEIYFKASDVLILPYTFVFQSGVIFLSYNFGLPVIASNVGEIENDIVEGQTGYVFEKEDHKDLAEKIELYFNSELYKRLAKNKNHIINYAKGKYSWEKIGKITCEVYIRMI